MPDNIRTDINDGKPWSDMDLRDLRAAVEHGRSVEEAATNLCRSGSVADVVAKAAEIGCPFPSGN